MAKKTLQLVQSQILFVKQIVKTIPIKATHYVAHIFHNRTHNK